MTEVPPGSSKLEARVGETVRLTLPGAGATGHVWKVSAPPSLEVQSMGHSATRTFGGRSIETIALTPSKTGTLRVRLLLQAPWRDTPAEVREVSIKVRL